MEYLKAFVLDGTSYEVSIVWEDDKPLFRANDVGKILRHSNIRTLITAYDDDEKVVRKAYTPGGQQDVIFLTEFGLYRVLMTTNKKVKNSFRKWVYEVLTEIRKTGKYELEKALQAKEEEKQIAIEAALREKAVEQENLLRQNSHETLLAAFRKKPVVYFGRIRTESDKWLVKIGSTDDLDVRVPGLVGELGSFQLFHVIECSQHRKFERFIQNHRMVLPFVYREPIFEGRRSNGEVFLMTEEEIKRTIDVAKRNLLKFLCTTTVQQLNELERLRHDAIDEEAAEIVPVPPRHVAEMAVQANVPHREIVPEERRYTQARGCKVQRYSADGRQLLKTYVGLTEASRDPDVPGDPVVPSIKRANKDNSVYKGFRWAELARELPDNHVQVLASTNESIIPVQKGYVAMLNLERTHIVNVFCDQKAAAENRQFKSLAAISKAIRCESKSGGHFFQMWDDVPPALQNAWLAEHTLPAKRSTTNSKGVRQIDPTTGACVHDFSSVTDIIKTFKVGRATLYKSIENGWTLKGFRWQWIE